MLGVDISMPAVKNLQRSPSGDGNKVNNYLMRNPLANSAGEEY